MNPIAFIEVIAATRRATRGATPDEPRPNRPRRRRPAGS